VVGILLRVQPMHEEDTFRHLGGGRKGLFLLLRYVFIIAASYLLIFESSSSNFPAAQGMMIAMALASNVALSFISEERVFAWYVEAPVLIADTLWVSWALQSTGSNGPELFLLYFFVLFLAALGENMLMVLLGSTLLSGVQIYFSAAGWQWTPVYPLRIVFFYTVALFYGYVLRQIKRERQRANKGFAWAKELEAKVAERTAQLSRLYQESLAANRLKSEFVANVSHELRTPLNVIVGYSELLLDNTTLGADDRAMVQRILEAARRQTDLVNSVLDLGRLESGKMPVAQQPLPLDRFVTDIQRRPRLPAARGVALEWRVEANLPVIETDPEKLTMVLENLLSNAVKFTSTGSITVTARDLAEAGRVEFRVDDTGPGMDTHDLQTIFEPFRQIDGSSTRRYGGTGLGLALVQRYAHLLGGAIEVHSMLGRGSSFVLTLPYRPARSAPAAAPSRAVTSLVDDAERARMVLSPPARA
jgi:signal transduction histidine kinase